MDKKVKFLKKLWTIRDPRKIREGGKTFRLLYMQKFRSKWLPSGEGKEE